MDIPEIIKVRTRNEGDNCTPLGYVTFIDSKTKKLRKEQSWSKWGDAFLGDFQNIPKSGFKLETTIKRSAEWFGSGRTMFRIQHPDNFLFEITSDNFSAIARSSTISKGEILSNCILAWDGATLSLIPTDSELYQEQMKLKAVVDAGPSNSYQIGKPYKNKNGKIIGYYGGAYVAVNIKHEYYTPFYYNVNISFSIINVFYYHTVNDGPGYSYDKNFNRVYDNNPTHNEYHCTTIANPNFFECSEDEINEYELKNLFNMNATSDVESFNEKYLPYSYIKLIPNTADHSYFENLAKKCVSDKIQDLKINYNRISDKYLLNRR